MSQQYMANPSLLDPNHRAAGTVNYQIRDPWEKLESQKAVFVHQDPGKCEWFSNGCCEQENKYEVFAQDTDGNVDSKKSDQLYKAKEKSSWCARHCMSAACQPFRVKLTNKDPISDEADDAEFLALDRDCTCTWLCFNRPTLTVSDIHKGASNVIGKVVNPCLPCALGADIYNESNEKLYNVRASCCQVGLLCKSFPCDACQHVHFDIKNQADEVVGALEKTGQGCFKKYTGSDADNFSLVFPEKASKQDKALLLSSILLLDFMYFESNSTILNPLN